MNWPVALLALLLAGTGILGLLAGCWLGRTSERSRCAHWLYMEGEAVRDLHALALVRRLRQRISEGQWPRYGDLPQ